MKEIRVYAVTSYDESLESLTDEQFINLAEKESLVWSLKGFQYSFNNGEVSDQWFIRII